MIALLPSAGYATRLYPLTENTPKALLEVGHKPMIEHILEKIAELPAITRVIVISNQKFFPAFKAWEKTFSKHAPLPITVLDDQTTSNETRLGAIGDVQFAIQTEHLQDDLLWISSDNLFSFSLKPIFSEFKKTGQDTIGLFDVKTKEEARKMGIVKLDANHAVTWFAEKPKNPPSTICSIGIYFYTQKTVQRIAEYLRLGYSPDKPGEFVEWLHKVVPVKGFVFNRPGDEWFDIGSPEMLAHVQKHYA